MMHDNSNINYKILSLVERLKIKNFLSTINSELIKLLSSELTIGVEIEFYCKEANTAFLNQILPEFHFVNERGEDQFEYHLGPYSSYNHEDICNKIPESMTLIEKKLSLSKLIADFDPKPYENDYGSSNQFQFSSESALFQDKIEEICASFCHYAKSTFLAYAQSPCDYKRFDSEFMAPTHISYGHNNRTCLIRINGEQQTRIEVRSPSSKSDPYLVLSAILMNIYKALTEESRLSKYPKIYGNSHDSQYNLDKIPETINDAEQLFDEKFFL